MTDNPKQKILVIKLGALGDFIQASGPFAALRRHHKETEITLLTSPAFVDFAAASPWFDKIEIDTRPKALQIGKWLELRRWLRNVGFSRIYDLQTSDRSGFYFKLLAPGTKPDWSGIAPGCSHPHTNPKRDLMHTIERQQEQLSMAGIAGVEAEDFSWIGDDLSRFDLAENFALLVPGGAAHRPAKRWPLKYYQELIQHLVSKNIQPVILGGEVERALLSELAASDPACTALTGETAIQDLFALAQKARIAIGNDTGPMHAVAASGCRTIVLYSAASDPQLCAQRGPEVTLLRENKLSDIAPSRIIDLLNL